MPDAVNPRLIVQLCEVTQGSPSSADKEWAPVGRLPNREMRVTAGISNPQHLEEPQESEDKGMRIRNHSINILIMGESLRKITLVVMPSVGALRLAPESTGDAITTMKDYEKDEDIMLFGKFFCPFVQRLLRS